MIDRLKRILLVRTDRIGDVVLTLPMLPFLRARYPDGHIAMLLSSVTGEIAEGNRYLDEVIWYDRDRSMIPFREMASVLRAKRFEAAILVHPTLRLALLLVAAGIPIRIATGYRYYSLLLNRRVYEHRRDARRHELEYNLRLLRELGCEAPDAGVDPDYGITVSGEAQDRVDQLLATRGIRPGDPFVVLHPGSGGSARDWPAESFRALCRLLVEKRRLPVVVTGNDRETALAGSVAGAAPGKAVSLAGLLTLKEIAALCTRASLFVANSTGPIHIASAMGTPVVGLYPQIPPMNPQRWGPYAGRKRVLVPDRPVTCTECGRGRSASCACMASIPVEQVFRASSELLDVPREHGQKALAHGT